MRLKITFQKMNSLWPFLTKRWLQKTNNSPNNHTISKYSRRVGKDRRNRMQELAQWSTKTKLDDRYRCRERTIIGRRQVMQIQEVSWLTLAIEAIEIGSLKPAKVSNLRWFEIWWLVRDVQILFRTFKPRIYFRMKKLVLMLQIRYQRTQTTIWIVNGHRRS